MTDNLGAQLTAIILMGAFSVLVLAGILWIMIFQIYRRR